MHNEFTAVFERDGDWYIATLKLTGWAAPAEILRKLRMTRKGFRRTGHQDHRGGGLVKKPAQRA